MANLSFHAGTEGKLKMSNMKGVLRHAMRNSEDGYKKHSNENIDTSKTKDNVDWTINRKPIEDIVNERIENEYKGKRKLRKDAVVIREVIVQPSADVFEGLPEDEVRRVALKFMEDSHQWFDNEFGFENVIGGSLHMDESNPHVHMMVMPMTEDGRISQKDFFKGPNDFKRQHREYREFMNNRGWDFDVENKYENADGVDLPTYKENAQEIEAKRQEQKAMLAELKEDPDLRAKAFGLAYEESKPQAKKQAYEDAYREQTSEKGDAYQNAYKDVHAVLLHEERERLAKEREGREKAQKAERERQAVEQARREAHLEKNREIARNIIRREGMMRKDADVDVRLADAYLEKHSEMNGKKMRTVSGERDVTPNDIYRSAKSKYEADLRMSKEVQTTQQQSQDLER